jgi:hypothetical protein
MSLKGLAGIWRNMFMKKPEDPVPLKNIFLSV